MRRRDCRRSRRPPTGSRSPSSICRSGAWVSWRALGSPAGYRCATRTSRPICRCSRRPGARRVRSSRGIRRSRSRSTRRIASGSCSATSGDSSCSGWGDGNAERGTRKSVQAFQFRVPTSAFRVSPLVYRPHALLPSHRGAADTRGSDRDHARLGNDHAFGGLTQETSVEVTGTVRADARAPGGVELTATDLRILGPSHDFPITPKEHGTAFLFEHRHLWLRSRRQVAIARVRHEVVQAIRDFFYERHFTLVDTPILTGAIGEHAGTLFATEYFDLGKAYLAQTGQLYVEAAAAALGKVYCFGPTFRAEKSKTRRHLTEFWMVEPEVAWNDSDDNMRLQEDFVRYVVARCLERDTAPLERVVAPFHRISYTDAVERLRGLGSDMTWGGDLGGEDETLLAK